jgi:DNA polymerase
MIKDRTRSGELEFLSQYRVCSKCSLAEDPENYPVVYRGKPSDIALIGEAPGKQERIEGKPFVGPAGVLLDKIFEAVGIDTEDMFITNVVWCRPVAPYGSGRENFTPKVEQIKKCWPSTLDLLARVQPKIIIACGLPALKAITGMSSPRMRDYEGQWLDQGDRRVFVMRHPASILHLSHDPQEQRRVKQQVWQYMQHFRDTYEQYLQEVK